MNQLHAKSDGKRRPKTKKKYSSSIYSTLGVSRFKSKAFHTWEEEKKYYTYTIGISLRLSSIRRRLEFIVLFFYFFLLIFYVFFKFDCKVNIGKPNQSRFVRWICLCSCVCNAKFSYWIEPKERKKNIYERLPSCFFRSLLLASIGLSFCLRDFHSLSYSVIVGIKY